MMIGAVSFSSGPLAWASVSYSIAGVPEVTPGQRIFSEPVVVIAKKKIVVVVAKGV